MISTLLLLALGGRSMALTISDENLVVSLSKAETQRLVLCANNKTYSDVQVWSAKFWFNHRIELRTLAGASVPMTAKGIKAFDLFESRNRDHNVPLVLKSGESWSYRTPALPEFFELQPGEYLMRVKYSDLSFEQPLQLTTSEVRIRVIE